MLHCRPISTAKKRQKYLKSIKFQKEKQKGGKSEMRRFCQ